MRMVVTEEDRSHESVERARAGCKQAPDKMRERDREEYTNTRRKKTQRMKN